MGVKAKPRSCDRCGRPVFRKHWFSVMRGYCLTRLIGHECITYRKGWHDEYQ